MLSSSTGVQFLVLALSSDDSEHRWKGSCALESPLSQLARKWANMHQVPENSVGFEWKGEELDLQKTAADYSFNPSEQVELLCFPKTEEFMEPVEPAKADVVVATSVGRKKVDAAKNSRPEQDQGVTEGSNKRKREASSAEAKSEKAETSKVEKKRPRGAGKENAPKVAKPSSAKGSGGEKTSAPGLEEPIQFLQTNPKKAGGTSFHRYEKYKHAKTVKEALGLGAAKGDIAYDWKQGFFKRV